MNIETGFKRVLALATFVLALASFAAAQQWQVISADYGAGERRSDVTGQVRSLANGNGQVQVNNDSMGGDPAPQQPKTLRIRAQGPDGRTQDFTYPENGYFDARQFSGGRGGNFGGGYPGGGGGGYQGGGGNWDRDYDRDRDRERDFRVRLRGEDQKRFDSYYTRWLDYQRSNDQRQIRSMEERMYDIYSSYQIPRQMPFDRIASVNLGGGPSFPGWGGPITRRGACFYQDPNFGGQYFCVDRGNVFPSVPPGFNDRITSIRVFGGSQVFIFNDSGFRGVSGRTGRDVRDLRAWRLPDNPSRTWNDRISSIQVR